MKKRKTPTTRSEPGDAAGPIDQGVQWYPGRIIQDKHAASCLPDRHRLDIESVAMYAIILARHQPIE